MLLRPATPDDARAVRTVVGAAFGDHHDVAALWEDVVRRGLSRAEVVAVEGDDVVGHVGVSHAWLDARRELVDVLVLSPLSVLPKRQGHGIGTALVAAAVDAARGLGTPALFLEGDPGYYGPRGFSAAAPLGLESPTRRIPGPAFQVALLPAHEAWMTGRLVYRDVWWEHDAAGLRDPRLAQVEGTRPGIS